MKALVYSGKEELTYCDWDDPVPQAGEHLVRIEAVGICGSDMHAFLGHDPRRVAPLILGHEAAGVIVGGKRNGERVTINPLVTCGTCQACIAGRENLCADRQIISMLPRQGAFAEMVSAPDRNLISVPDNVSLEVAALAEPLAVSWHSARLGLEGLHPSMDRKALIIGGGAIGLAAALALQAMGLDDVTIVEPNETRRSFVERSCGQNAVAETNKDFPLVVDAVGYAATRRLASERVLPGGVIVHIGLGDAEGGLDIRRATLQEITFIGTYTYTHQDFVDTAHAIYDGSLGALNWTEQRALKDGAQAFNDIRAGVVPSPKIILQP